MNFHGDDDILVQVSPDDPLTEWYRQGWWGHPGGTAHCNVTGPLYKKIQFPRDAIFNHWGHNNAAGIVGTDNRTVTQTQPLYRCEPGSPVLSNPLPPQFCSNQDLVTSNGTHGAHGGSGLR